MPRHIQKNSHVTILNNQKGFTLIELIMVIVLLGLLSAVAIPRYQDLKSDAEVAQAEGLYGAAQGAAAINFAKNVVGTSAVGVITTATLLDAALDGGFPDDWTVAAGAGTTVTKDMSSVTYTITVATGENASNKAVITKDW